MLPEGARVKKNMFDRVVENNTIEYGIINGDNRLFFVKVGNGGSIYGRDDRYLKMAERIHNAHGCSVLVSGDPVEIPIKDNIIFDLELISESFPDVVEITAFGHSKGGQMLVSYAYMYPMIRNVLAVNVPLMINLHKTKAGIKNFEGNKIHMIYGDRDPSFPYAGILDSSLSSRFGYSIVKNADHNFENMSEEFISLPERFLF